jgi:hypothetical protein
MRLKLPDWAALAEIAGTVAVVISLLFVAHNLERNTATISAQVSDDTYDALREIEGIRLASPELLALTGTGPPAFSALDAGQRELYVSWIALYLDEWERIYSRRDDGLIQPQNLDDWHAYFENWAERYVTPEVWADIRWRYAIGSVGEYMEQRFDDPDPQEPPD